MTDLRAVVAYQIANWDGRELGELMDSVMAVIDVHQPAEITRLTERLRVAEAVCVMYSVSPAHLETEREKAAYEVWLTWSGIVGHAGTTEHPDLTDEQITELAHQHDARRAEVLALAQRGKQESAEPESGASQ